MLGQLALGINTVCFLSLASKAAAGDGCKLRQISFTGKYLFIKKERRLGDEKKEKKVPFTLNFLFSYRKNKTDKSINKNEYNWI